MTIGKIGSHITWLGRPGIIIAVGKGLAKYTIEIKGKNSTRLEIFSQKEFTKNITIICDNSTCAVGSVQGSLLLESPRGSNYSDSVNGTNGASQSLNSDTQELKSRQKCETWNAYDKLEKKHKSSPRPHPVNPSVSKESDRAETTTGIVYPTYKKSSKYPNPHTGRSKTSQGYSVSNEETTSDQSSTMLTNVGTMQNGLLSVQGTLEAPSLEKDYCWLQSPGALSSDKSQPPGLTKLESQLKSQGMLLKGEVLDPAFLLSGLGIPEKFLDLECPDEAKLLDDSGKQPETFSIQGWQESHSTGCSTSNQSGSNQSGSIYKYEKNIKGVRYPKDASSWYYGYSYVIQIDGRWCDRSKSVSTKKLPFVEQMIAMKRNYLEILGFLR
jgi:hypothetical protein